MLLEGPNLVLSMRNTINGLKKIWVDCDETVVVTTISVGQINTYTRTYLIWKSFPELKKWDV